MPALVAEHGVHHSYHPYQTLSLPRPLRHCFSTSSTGHNSPVRSMSSSALSSSMSPSNPECNGEELSQQFYESPSPLSINRRSVLPSDGAATQQAMENTGEHPSRLAVVALSPPNNWAADSARTQSHHRSLPSRISVSPARAPHVTQPVEDIVSYLKGWRAPVEYYARRRYHHPSLSYPSRRPSLPALVEECFNDDGLLDLVKPELVVPRTSRIHQRRPLSAHIIVERPTMHYTASQGWDEESDEEMDSEDDDIDDGTCSETDSDEAVTPTSSPICAEAYFLQPLILTKPPGY